MDELRRKCHGEEKEEERGETYELAYAITDGDWKGEGGLLHIVFYAGSGKQEGKLINGICDKLVLPVYGEDRKEVP